MGQAIRSRYVKFYSVERERPGGATAGGGGRGRVRPPAASSSSGSRVAAAGKEINYNNKAGARPCLRGTSERAGGRPGQRSAPAGVITAQRRRPRPPRADPPDRGRAREPATAQSRRDRATPRTPRTPPARPHPPSASVTTTPVRSPAPRRAR
ncbi:hypothetical protein EVAR_7833_1 [Eumeta japonica]|uniref:Uncharacterized protein n=1 Tax=Eumeta variegata TaxID=151549 RepID=A0A4C1TV16_EUMVA|nr:hypothetical protein EVAR_7833_1 [Eumeta japonica]